MTQPRPSPLAGCSGCGSGTQCGHLWTRRYGTAPNAAVQQIDYISATAALAEELQTISGGTADYPLIADFA